MGRVPVSITEEVSMKICLARSSVRLDTDPERIRSATKEIELAARVSHQTSEKVTENSHLEFTRHLIERGHEAALEFGPRIQATFVCSRAIANEIVRHRLASYMQESTRYVNYADSITFILPIAIRLYAGAESDLSNIASTTGAQVSLDDSLRSECIGLPMEDGGYMLCTWFASVLYAYDCYRKLMNLGVPRQIARDVLPMCLKTELVVSANIREWRHIFALRTSKSAHPEMRFLMGCLKSMLADLSPVLFDGG